MSLSAGSPFRNIWSSRSARSAAAVCFTAAILLASAPASAAWIPGMGDSIRGFYFSKDRDLIRVTLSQSAGGTASSQPLAVFEIPRAYIYLSSRHAEKEVPVLPSEIVTEAIHIAMTYPDGMPYSLALYDPPERKRAAEARQRALGDDTTDRFRFVRVKAQILGSVADAHDSPSFRPGGRERYVDDYREGRLTLARYATSRRSQVYFGRPGDLIRRVDCAREVEQTNPAFLCDYYTVLSSRVIAKVTFVDFRVNGGVEFARQRISAFRATACRYVDCD